MIFPLMAAAALSCSKAEPERIIVKETETVHDTLTVTTPSAGTPSWGSNPVRVGIIGDSISTFDGWIPEGWRRYYPYTGSAGSLTSVEQTWWHRLIYRCLLYTSPSPRD